MKENIMKNNKGKLPMFDIPFFIGILLLLAVGLIMLFSAGYADAFNKTGDSYYYIRKQLIAAGLGLIGMFVLSFVPYTFYRRFSTVFYIACVVLLVIVLLVSNESEKRWIYIGGFQFQPSELAKVAVIIALSDYIARNRKQMKTFKTGVLLPSCLFLLVGGLVLAEPHLSGAILVFSIGMILIVAGGCKIRHTLPIIGGGVVAAVVMVMLKPYMLNRIKTWLNPESDILGDGWQTYQSLLTIGSGGLFGLGFGKSRQKYLYMSEPQNDFIFSIVCEELGFIGAIFVVALFIFLIWRGIHIAMRSPNTFSSLIVLGVIGRIAVQVIFNIAVVTNTFPVTGIPLPFFSYGGTALVVLLCEMGLVLYISRFMRTEKGTDEVSEETQADEAAQKAQV